MQSYRLYMVSAVANFPFYLAKTRFLLLFTPKMLTFAHERRKFYEKNSRISTYHGIAAGD